MYLESSITFVNCCYPWELHYSWYHSVLFLKWLFISEHSNLFQGLNLKVGISSDAQLIKIFPKTEGKIISIEVEFYGKGEGRRPEGLEKTHPTQSSPFTIGLYSSLHYTHWAQSDHMCRKLTVKAFIRLFP